MSILHSSFNLESLPLANRIVMAPMTRSRAIGAVANDLMATYYAQRASAGLIITEGTSPSRNGLGYCRIPGLFTKEQADSWLPVTRAVHQQGGKIFVQLMHTGRVAHYLNLPKGACVFAPSEIPLPGSIWTDQEGMMTHSTPFEMSIKDIKETINEFVQSAQLAMHAGFDGVEIHGANGYLIDQFLNVSTNKRQDEWGGSVTNRIKFAVQLARAISKEIGAEKVGFRISPKSTFHDMYIGEEMDETYIELAKELDWLGIAYMHLITWDGDQQLRHLIRKNFTGAFILAGGFDAAKANQALVSKEADLISFGRAFIANPTLVEKFRSGVSLTEIQADKLYTSDEEGYIDYE